MNADRGPAPVKFLAQLKTLFRRGRDIGWRDETGVHLPLLNAEGL
jgi:hypothetical protein